MAFDTFPLPSVPPSVAEAGARIAAMSQMLMPVVTQLYGSIEARQDAQAAALQSVQQTLQRSLAARNGQLARMIGPAVGDLQNAVTERLASFAGQLAPVQIAAGSGVASLSNPPAPTGFTPGWYCATHPEMGVGVKVVQINDPTGFTLIAGPFPDQQTATAACLGGPVPLPLPPGSPVAPPVPPQPQPTPIAVPPAPPEPIEVFGVATTPPTLAPPAQPAQPLPEPTLTPPERPVPAPSQPWQCPMPEALRGGLPPPGSVEFCAALNELAQWFADAGNLVFAFIDNSLDSAYIQQLVDNAPSEGSVTNPLGYLKDVAVWLLGKVAQLAGPLLDTVRAVVNCARQWATLVFGRCNVAVLSGLLAFRSVAESLQEFAVGWELGPKVESHIRVDLGPIIEVLDYLVKWSCPTECPHWGEAVEAWLRGLVSDDYLTCILRLNGQDPDVWAPFIAARGERLSPKEAVQLVRRHKGDAADERAWLRKLGWVDDVSAGGFQELYEELPSIGDHLEWLRKNVFDEEYVRDFKLMDGFEEKFWPKFGHDLHALGMRKEYAELHYAAHWLNPSFSQLFEMAQRLRPGRVEPALQFTRNDLLRVMVEQDVGVYFRERLEAISHPALNLTLCLKMYAARVFDDNEFVQRLQDLGYDDVTSAALVKGLKLENARMRGRMARAWTPPALAKAVHDGFLDRPTAESIMSEQGFTADELDRAINRLEFEEAEKAQEKVKGEAESRAHKAFEEAYKAGAIGQDDFVAALVEQGAKRDDCVKLSLAIDSEVNASTFKANVAAVRKAVLRGRATLPQAQALLGGLGMAQGRIGTTLALWRSEFAAASPAGTASQLLKWVGEGLLSAGVAQQRLVNLGWSDPDLTIMLAEAQEHLVKMQARVEAARAKTDAKASADAARLRKAAQKQVHDIEAMIKRWTSPAKLQKWFATGVIEEEELRQRLHDMGMPDHVAEDYVKEAQEMKTGKVAKRGKTKAPPPAPRARGPGGLPLP